METMLDRAYRTTGALVTLVAPANAGALAIFTPSTFAGQIGTKTFITRKLRVRNLDAGNTWIHFGTGVAGAVVENMPPAQILNAVDDAWQEVQLPAVQFWGALMAFADAVGTGIQIQVEVEENG